VVWGKQAEIAQQYLKKGSLIFIEGRIQSREWQDKEGQKRTSFEIVATNFRMLGGRGDERPAEAVPWWRTAGEEHDQSAAEKTLAVAPAAVQKFPTTIFPSRRFFGLC
jgi:single-strand DNA-binding protein